MRRMATLSEQALKDKNAAYGWYLKMFGEEPKAEGVTVEAERLAQETGGWAELVGAYENAYSRASTSAAPQGALPLMLVVARVYEELDENSAQAIGVTLTRGAGGS
jgi:hypothetical protein